MLSVNLCRTLLCGVDDEEQIRQIRDALYQLATICVDMYIEENAEGVGGEQKGGREDRDSTPQG